MLWMADQVCPLLAYVGLGACTPKTDLYLVGVAGWIFGGLGLLMLMGIAEAIEDGKAERKRSAQEADRVSSSLQITITDPNRHPPNDARAVRRLIHRRVRPLKRLPPATLADIIPHSPSKTGDHTGPP